MSMNVYISDYPNGVRPAITSKLQTQIMAGLQREFSLCSIHQMFPISLPRTVIAAKVSWQPNIPELTATVDRMLEPYIIPPAGSWFRPLSFDSLELAITYFQPPRTFNSYTDCFGPGMYTSDNLEYALSMNGPGTALVVFHKLDEINSVVCDLPVMDWFRVVAHFLSQPPGQASVFEMSEDFLEADFIRGPVPVRMAMDGPIHGNFQQSQMTRLVARSLRGFAVLGAALKAIIFFD